MFYHNAQVRHGRGCQSQTAAVAAKRNRLEWLPGASLCRFGAGSLIGSLLLGKLAASWAFAHTHTAPVRGLSCSMAPLVEGIFPTLAGRSNISRQCRANRKQRNDENNYEHAASHQNSLVEGVAVCCTMMMMMMLMICGRATPQWSPRADLHATWADMWPINSRPTYR